MKRALMALLVVMLLVGSAALVRRLQPSDPGRVYTLPQLNRQLPALHLGATVSVRGVLMPLEGKLYVLADPSSFRQAGYRPIVIEPASANPLLTFVRGWSFLRQYFAVPMPRLTYRPATYRLTLIAKPSFVPGPPQWRLASEG